MGSEVGPGLGLTFAVAGEFHVTSPSYSLVGIRPMEPTDMGLLGLLLFAIR